jgi:2'-5' RNA ligase
MRAFVAVDLEPAVRAEIAAATETLCGAGGDVRWVSTENLHVTLKFLGSVAEKRLGAVRAALERVVAVAAPFELTVRGFGTFPSAARARVIWVGLVAEGLRALAQRVDDEIGAQGFPRETRPFAPHVTIGRVRSPRGWSRVAAALTPYGDKVFGRSDVTDVVLYRSDLHPQGARYTALDRFGLAGADEVGPSPRH